MLVERTKRWLAARPVIVANRGLPKVSVKASLAGLCYWKCSWVPQLEARIKHGYIRSTHGSYNPDSDHGAG